MDQLGNILSGLDQEQAIVVLFALLIAFCTIVAALATVLNSLGSKGKVAFFLGLSLVLVVWLLAR